MSRHLGPDASGLVDGSLRPGDRERAQAHLVGCALCRVEVAELRAVRARLRGGSVPSLTDELHLRLSSASLSALGPDPRAPSAVRPRGAYALAGAMSVTGAAAVLVLFAGGQGAGSAVDPTDRDLVRQYGITVPAGPMSDPALTAVSLQTGP